MTNERKVVKLEIDLIKLNGDLISLQRDFQLLAIDYSQLIKSGKTDKDRPVRKIISKRNKVNSRIYSKQSKIDSITNKIRSFK